MIEVNGVIYRNLEEQVQKNKDDIENLKNQQSGDDSDIEQIDNRLTEVETTLTEITPNVMRALKTPISAPNETKIVAVDNTNSQEMIGIGTGLIIENNKLKSTGGTEIIDNLTSSSISAGLSANQGRVLDGKISSLETLVGTKANQSSLNTTNQNVSQNATKISSLETLVGTNITDIENIETQISNLQSQKANQSSLDTTNQNVSNLDTNKANKDLSNATVEIFKYETIYDKNSDDSSINWGYTNGIQGNTRIQKDLTKYKMLILYTQRIGDGSFILIDLTTPINAQEDSVYRGFNAWSYLEGNTYYIQGANAYVNSTKTQIGINFTQNNVYKTEQGFNCYKILGVY